MGEEVKQHSNPYANLSERAVRRAQVNALKTMVPALDSNSQNTLPRGAIDLGDGFILLRAQDTSACGIRTVESEALRQYLNSKGHRADEDEWRCPDVVCWARVRLPKGQIAQSYWKEQCKTENSQMSHNVKVRYYRKIATIYSPIFSCSCRTIFKLQKSFSTSSFVLATIAFLSRWFLYIRTLTNTYCTSLMALCGHSHPLMLLQTKALRLSTSGKSILLSQ